MIGQARHEREDMCFERGENGLTAVFGHHLVEARETLVGNAAAGLEAVDDGILDTAQKRNVLSENGHVVCGRSPGHERRVLRRQAERAA
jgi:hypothetical protein